MTTVQTPSGLRTITRQSPLGSESPVRTVGNAGRVPLLRGDLVGTYEAMYKNQLWVWVLVNKIMRGISRLPWKTFEYLDDERQQVQRVRVHPLTDLINNPWPRAGAWHLKEAISGGLLIHGNSVFYKYRSGPGAPPSQLWALPWRNVDVVHDNFVALYYVFRGVHDRIALLPEDVVHFRLWGGGGPIGISPLEPLRRTLALEDAAQEYSARYMDNSATPSALFHTDKNIKKESADRLRTELERLYGGLQNAGRFAVLGDGFQVTPLQHNLVDTDLIRQRQLNREEVAAAYDVAPPIVGILDRATFNNVEELHGMLYTDTLPPWTQNIARRLTSGGSSPPPTRPTSCGEPTTWRRSATLPTRRTRRIRSGCRSTCSRSEQRARRSRPGRPPRAVCPRSRPLRRSRARTARPNTFPRCSE